MTKASDQASSQGHVHQNREQFQEYQTNKVSSYYIPNDQFNDWDPQGTQAEQVWVADGSLAPVRDADGRRRLRSLTDKLRPMPYCASKSNAACRSTDTLSTSNQKYPTFMPCTSDLPRVACSANTLAPTGTVPGIRHALTTHGSARGTWTR